MITPEFFVNNLKNNGIDFFTGVPDSLLKSVCAYITDSIDTKQHIIAVNEGLAVGLAAGYHLATGKVPMVYMQNSGIGNAVNPLLSLMDKDVYNMPLLLLIGWRGEPDTKDEPQHVKQGKVTIPLLDAMRIQNEILSDNESIACKQIISAIDYAKRNNICAFIVRKNTFGTYKSLHDRKDTLSLSREDAIKTVIDNIEKDAIIVSTTGMISRELFEYREQNNAGHCQDFLTVGSMGHASQIALGIALNKPAKAVYCFDGDGAALMHLGGIATIGVQNPKNFVHILFNNGAHDSVGGQPTVGLDIDLPEVAKAVGYKSIFSMENKIDIKRILSTLKPTNLPAFMEIKVKRGNRADLGRPTTSPVQNKKALMEFLSTTT
jgi:phosphonopyruvate decarboxylase